MASLIFYIGQAVYVSFIKDRKKQFGVGIVLLKEIDKGEIKYELLGADGKVYPDIEGSRMRHIYDTVNGKRVLVLGPAVTGTIRAVQLKTQLVKDKKEAWVSFLKALIADIKANKLLVGGVNFPDEKPFEEETDGDAEEAATFERISKYSGYNNSQNQSRWNEHCEC